MKASDDVRVFIVAGQSNAIPLGESIRRLLASILPRGCRVVHIAEGGTPLADIAYATPSWHPRRRGELYDTLLHRVEDELREIRAGGLSPQLEAVFWMQGEQDAKTRGGEESGGGLPAPPQPSTMERYGENLEYLIRSLRSDLGTPHLRFILATTPVGSPADWLSDRFSHRGIPKILAAQAAVAATTEGVFLVETSDCDRGEDGGHLSAAASEEVARRMIGKYLAIRSPGGGGFGQ